MPWPQYFDGKGWDNEISTSFDIHSIPITFLLDGQGIVRYANLRGSALEHAVAEVLVGPSSSTAQITDAGLAYLKGMTSLETLYFENTQVGDDGLAHLKDLTSLKVLYIGGTEVTDVGLAYVENLTGLQRLCVHKTQVSDAGLAHLKDLVGLEYLCVRDTQVADAGLTYLQGLTSLQTLHLHNTQVSSVGLAELKQALPNCRILGMPAPKQPRRVRQARMQSRPQYRWQRRPSRRRHADIPLHLQILIAVIGIPIVSLLSAVFLRMATRWAVKFGIPYWTAYKITLIASVVCAPIGFGMQAVLASAPGSNLLALVVNFFVAAAFYDQMIKQPESGESIGFGKGLLISFYLVLISLVVGLIIGLLLSIIILFIVLIAAR